MKFIQSLLLITTLASTAVFANPTDKSIEELAKYSAYDSLFYTQINDALIEDRVKLAYIVTNNPKLSEDERKKALEIYDEYAEGLMKTLDTADVRAALKKSYISAAKSVYNQKEVDAQLAFYGSVDGQNALKKESTLLTTYLKNAEEVNKKTVKPYVDKNQKKMEDELKKILKK